MKHKNGREPIDDEEETKRVSSKIDVKKRLDVMATKIMSHTKIDINKNNKN